MCALSSCCADSVLVKVHSLTKSKTSVWTCVYSLHLLFFSQHLHDWMVSEVEHERERAINTWFKLLQYFTEVMDPSVSIGVGSRGVGGVDNGR